MADLRWSNFNGYRGRTVAKPGGGTTTIFEHREVMERELGRKLRSDEHVHHRDGNRSNNDPSNLEVLTPAEHGAHHAVRIPALLLKCVRCGVSFERRGNSERHNRKQKKVGPFCGKSCAGKWSREQQLARRANAQQASAPGRLAGEAGR